ncbi:hypothetical protein NPX13_g5627 [Xylaria arbuscula]|uniref:Uncharacterized protein n=1 Tax=Xylaria arbuscula TaxID=114810 RepID=A0A9W8TM82_9PEZI|nr:hypothetical protein NPX13_g5627 [Xylaria arbuscula]
MVYNTRSHRQRPLQASQRRADNRQGLRIPVKKGSDEQRRNNDSKGKASHTSAILTLSEDSSSSSNDESETCSTPIRSHPSRVSPPSKARRRAEVNSKLAPPKPGREFDDHHLLGDVRIVHYKHNPPQRSGQVSPDQDRRLSRDIPIHRQFALSRFPVPRSFLHHSRYALEQLQSSSILFSALERPPPAVITIVASPHAAIHFLRCFLTRKSHWLKSRDRDTDHDKCFWSIVTRRFNENDLGYHIGEWSIARVIAMVLCSDPYREQIEQKRRLQEDELLSRLISEIDDCREMSHRRKLQQSLDPGRIKTMTVNETLKDDVQEVFLPKPITTIEGYNDYMKALAEKEEKRTTATVVARVQATDRSQQGQTSSKPHGPASQSKIQLTNKQVKGPNVPRNAPSAAKRTRGNQSMKFRRRGGPGRQDGPSHPSPNQPRRQFGGVPSTKERTEGYRRSRQQFKATYRGSENRRR